MSRSRRTDFILWRSSAFLLDLYIKNYWEKIFGKCTGGIVGFILCDRTLSLISARTPHMEPPITVATLHATSHAHPRVARFVYIHILCHHTEFQSCLRINHNLAHITRDRVQCGTLYNRVALDTTQTLLRCLVFSLVWFWFSYFHNKVLI